MSADLLGCCHVCGKPGQARCSRCQTVTYCGPECQRSDWKRHKADCSASRGRTASAAQPPPSAAKAEAESARPSFAPEAPKIPTPLSGVPGDPAPVDVVLSGSRSVETAQRVIDKLMEKGVCVIKAGADRTFVKQLQVESRLLWDSGEFAEAKKGQPVVPGSAQVKYDTRDDRVVWMTSEWTQKNQGKCKALKVLDDQLGDFGWGLNTLLEEQLGITLKQRTTGMLACYAGDVVPGARYDFHVDNPYQTSMEVVDDKRRLTLIYYINDANWDVRKDGGALQVCLANPRRALRTTAEANQHPKLTISPECDTLVAFFAHTMYHAVLPVVGDKRRCALSTWFMCA
mmetsp:Transcript_70802/g.207462  ORF Transcript_70802/g.207462 Transcript_70802/m.207462 type:complete len:343 (-) Transcript_70802:229-1257(-)